MKASLLIVGTDLSEASIPAIVQGAAWAQRHGMSLVVAHVDTTWGVSQPDAPEKVAAVRKWLAPHTDVEAEVVIRSGSAHAELIQLASERDAALLVVAGTGGGSFMHSLLGSTASSVARYAGCSVLVARESPAGGPIVVGTDFSDAVEPALKAAAVEAKKSNAELILLHSMHEPKSPLSILGPVVVSPPQVSTEARQEWRSAAETTLQSLLAAHGATGKTLVVDEEPSLALKEEARKSAASLLVVGTHGRTALERMALGSVAERVAGAAECSVLVARKSSD